MMKKIYVILIFITVILVIISIFSLAYASPKKTASADGGAEVVLRVEKDNVYFYSSHDFLEAHKLFLLVKTYFLIGVDMGDYFAVQYKKDTDAEISGFVKKSDVEIYNDGVPSLLYPVFKAETTRTFLPLFCDINIIESLDGYTKNLTDFYGEITINGETYIRAYYNGPVRFGTFEVNGSFYVKCSELEITEPEAHPIPLKVISENPGKNPDGDNTASNNSNEAVQIIIIIAVIIFAVAVVYFMFKPNNYKYKRNKDNDDM